MNTQPSAAAPAGLGRLVPENASWPLLGGMLAMLLLLATGMGIGIYQLDRLTHMLGSVVRQDDASREGVQAMLIAARGQSLALAEAASAADASAREAKLREFERLSGEWQAATRQLAAVEMSDEEEAALARLRALDRELSAHLEAVVGALRDGKAASQQAALYATVLPVQDRLLEALMEWEGIYHARHGIWMSLAEGQQKRAVSVMLGFTAVAVLLGLALSAVVYRRNGRLLAGLVAHEAELRDTLAELALRERAMDEHSIVSVADASGAITYVNRKFCEVSGYRPEELIGANHRIVKSDFHPPEFFRQMWDTISSGRVWRGEVKNRAKNGEPYWVETTIVPMLDENGLPLRYISVRTEITNIMEMEEAVRQANTILRSNVIERTQQLEQAKLQLEQELIEREHTHAALQQSYDELHDLHRQLQETQQYLLQSEKLAAVGQLAAGMAHEINNPIGFIGSNLAALGRYQETLERVLARYRALEGGLSDADRAGIAALRETADLDYLLEDARALLAESRDGVERVRRIVQDLRDFSRVDSAGQRQWLDIHHSLDAALGLLADRLGALEVQREYGTLPQIECRPAELNQAFFNLLDNAVKAGSRRITLRTRHEDDQIHVEVEDDGEGIADTVLPQIFDPFFTTRPVGQGAGLGLSLAYGVVQQHGGQITVSSQPGQGARFRVCLPLGQAGALVDEVLVNDSV